MTNNEKESDPPAPEEISPGGGMPRSMRPDWNALRDMIARGAERARKRIQTGSQTAAPVIEVDSAAKPVVLVVNDDASTRESLAHLLRSASLSVTTLASVEDYLALKRRSVPACLVLDMEMPATNGLELLSAMAERNDNTPTIFVSGQGDLRTCVRIMKAGASDFLPKPLKIEELLAAIQQALDRSLAAIEQQRLLGDKLSHVADPLKPRELELLKLLIEGRSTTEIAARLGSSSASIRNQRSLLIEKCHRSLENQPPCEA